MEKYNSDLMKVIEKTSEALQQFSVEQIYFFVGEILKGLHYIHFNNMAHLDLKVFIYSNALLSHNTNSLTTFLSNFTKSLWCDLFIFLTLGALFFAMKWEYLTLLEHQNTWHQK